MSRLLVALLIVFLATCISLNASAEAGKGCHALTKSSNVTIAAAIDSQTTRQDCGNDAQYKVHTETLTGGKITVGGGLTVIANGKAQTLYQSGPDGKARAVAALCEIDERATWGLPQSQALRAGQRGKPSRASSPAVLGRSGTLT